ncbi:MAG: hypothetical protein WAN72_15975 [Candidatus Acidiferrales bacterium]
MRTQLRFATSVLIGAMFAASAWMALPALAQEPAQPANNQNQSQQPAPPAEHPAPPELPAAPQPASQKQPGTTTKQQQNIQHEKDTGTSKDRIFWTLPNFLTLEEADNIPPLTSGQKLKVVGRSLIDPSEFVLIGFVAGLGQASNIDASYGQGAEGYGKR